MRVVSLVPAATEIAYAIGAQGDVVAVTHDDDYPPEVRRLPVVTRSTIPADASAGEIDRRVRDAAAHGDSTFHLDDALVRELRPDVILGQTLCAVCAVTLDRIPQQLDHPARVVPLDASTIDGVFEDIRRVGEALGRADAAHRLIAALAARIEHVRRSVAGRPRPRVACLEWLDPLFNAGHWVPEQVEIAGGTDVLGSAGARSREIVWDDVLAARPDYMIAMPCGWDAPRAALEAAALPAMGRTHVFGVDGAAYFSRPGPRVVDGAELIASILHPDAVAAPHGAIAVAVSSSMSRT